MVNEQNLARKINKLFEEELLIEVESPDSDLLKSGLLDSLTLVRLLLQLEERFGLKVSMENLEINDFRSIRSIAAWVAGQAGDEAPASGMPCADPGL